MICKNQYEVYGNGCEVCRNVSQVCKSSFGVYGDTSENSIIQFCNGKHQGYMMGGAGSMAVMAEAAEKNRKKLAERMARHKKLVRMYQPKARPVRNNDAEKISKGQLDTIIADIRTKMAKERKNNRKRAFIVGTLIAVLVVTVILYFI